MTDQLLIGLALVLVVEGLLPFLSPAGMRRAAAMVAQMPERVLRTSGLISMLSGVGLLYFVV